MTSSEQSSSQWQPLYLSCVAGASTCIGAAVVFLQPVNDENKRNVPPGMLAFSLALAGSVMVTVSLISIIPECLQDDSIDDGKFHMIPFFHITMAWRVFFFLLGAALYFALSWFMHVPEPEDLLNSENLKLLIGGGKDSDKDVELNNFYQSEIRPLTVDINNTNTSNLHSSSLSKTKMRPALSGSRSISSSPDNSPTKSNNDRRIDTTPTGLRAWSTGKDLQNKDQRKAWRVAMLLFVSLLVHNFPEGLAVAASALESQSLGITVTIGIMIHNIPEGIAIAVPCLAARPDSPLLAFVLASVSGLAEPAGAFVALLFLWGVEDEKDAILSLENILAFVAGIMITVALLELFPEARRNAVDTKKFFWYGTVAGAVIMTLTELLLP